MKKNLRLFNGFDFARDSAEYEKKRDVCYKLTMAELKKVAKLLDFESVSLKKEDLTTKILDFLLAPKESGRALPSSKKAKKAKRSRKGAKKGAKTTKATK